MATYKASGFTLSNPLMDSGTGGDVTAVFSIATTEFATDHLLVTGDVVELAKIPKGAVITDFLVTFPDIDSATTSELDLGLTTQDPNAFVAASAKGRSAGDTMTPGADGVQGTGVPLECTCAAATPKANGYDVFALYAKAGGAGAGAGGTIKGWVRYNMRGTVR